MKLSARNQLAGKIVGATKGQTTAHVRIDVDDLGLKIGGQATAIIKSSDVIIGG